MLTPESFKCERCTDCCKHLVVKLCKKDISRIEEKGYKDFFVYDKRIKGNVLKHKNFKCVFLGKKNCKIYSIRPKVCREYPFVVADEVWSCKPQTLGNLFKKN